MLETGAVESVALYGDIGTANRFAVSTAEDGVAAVWDIQSGSRVHEFRWDGNGAAPALTAAVWSPPAGTFVAAFGGGGLQVRRALLGLRCRRFCMERDETERVGQNVMVRDQELAERIGAALCCKRRNEGQYYAGNTCYPKAAVSA